MNLYQNEKDAEEDYENYSSDEIIDDLKSQLDEKEFIINTTKEYLFVLEYELENKNKEIRSLKKYKKENQLLKSTFSWKITKPLRWIKKLLH